MASSGDEHVLYDLIDNERWGDAMARMRTEEGREELRRKGRYGSGLPLHWACRWGAPLELVKAMVEGYPESVRVTDNNFDQLPLHWACWRGDDISPRVVRLLLDAHPEGAKATDKWGWLPLQYAAHNKAPLEVLGMLVDAHPEGAATRTIEGYLPIHRLAEEASPDKKEDVEKVELLIRPLLDNEEACRTADPDNNMLPLHIAAKFGLSVDIIRSLIRPLLDNEGACRTADRDNGMLPLHIAAQFNLSFEILRTLCGTNKAAARTPCRYKDEEGRTTDVYPLDLLEMRRPAADGTEAEIAAFNDKRNLLFTERGDVYAMGCTTDSPLRATDCLGYTVYAEALARAARMVETSSESLCVGLYGTWGCGRSVLWSLVSKQLDALNLEEDVERFERLGMKSVQMKNALEALDNSDAVDPRIKDKWKKKRKERGVSLESESVRRPGYYIFWLVICFLMEKLCGALARALRSFDNPVDHSFLYEERWNLYKERWKGQREGINVDLIASFEENCWAVWIVTCFVMEKLYDVLYCGDQSEAGNDSGNELDEEVAVQDRSCCKSRKDERIALIIVLLSPVLLLAALAELLLPILGWLIFGSFATKVPPSHHEQAQRVWNIFTGRTGLGLGDAPFFQPELNESSRVLQLEGMVRNIILVLSQWVVSAFTTMKWLIVSSFQALGCSKRENVPRGSGMYIKVVFNAWVYQGSDLLWASLIRKLWEEVESVFGKRQVRLHRWSITVSGETSQDTSAQKGVKRRAAQFNFQVKAIASSMLGLAGAVLLTFFGVTYEDFLKNAAAKVFAYLGVLGPFSVQAYKWLLRWYQFMRLSQGQQLYDEAKKYERYDFKEETGFMGKVRDEVDYLFDFLRTTTFYDKEARCHRKARLCIFVDDLDRCESKKIVSMLQAVKLLLDDAPVTCWLAIDSRIIVSSVEEEYKGVFAEEGISGHEFLDKIVQLPFCLPTIDRENKLAYLYNMIDAKKLCSINILDRLCRVKSVRDLIGLSTEDITQASNTQALKKLVHAAKQMLEKNLIEDTTTPLVGIGMTKAELTTTMHSGSDPNNLRSDLKNGFLFMLSEETYRLANEAPTPQAEADTTPQTETNTTSQAASALQNISSEESRNETRHGTPPEIAAGGAISLWTGSFNTAPEEPGAAEPDEGTTIPTENTKTRVMSQEGGPFVSMLDMNERKHLASYVEFIDGNPRKMKRIINIFNVTRHVFFKHGLPRDSRYSNIDTCRALLLKFVILLEQWPYRMAWLLQIVEDAQQMLISKNSYGTHITEAGHELFDLLKQLAPQTDIRDGAEVRHVYTELSAGLVHRKIVQGLIYSPHNATKFLARDADPQMFECLLNVEPKVMLIDLDQLLRPYAFNIQKSLMDTVARMCDECALLPKGMQKEEKQTPWWSLFQQKRADSGLKPESQWLTYYKKKAALFGEEGPQNCKKAATA